MKTFLMRLHILTLMFNSKIANDISKILLRKSLKIATAESCTGGLISSRLTDIAGSSAYIHANFVTYSNSAKQRFLNVSDETLEKYGAVSRECAEEMVKGLLKLTNADIALCTTGVAGPASSEGKPVGLMFVGCGYNNNITIKEVKLSSNYSRKNLKFLFSEEALKLVYEILQ